MDLSRRNSTRRVTDLYRGPGGRFWDRIEEERPATYLEENVALGRRQEAALLRAWMGDLSGLRILDAGCGHGLLARQLAAGGARVIAADLLPRFAAGTRAAARRGELTLVVADYRDLVPAGKAAEFDILLLREVAQDYEPAEYARLFEPLAMGGARRLLLTLRQDSLWSPVIRQAWPEGVAESVDTTTLLRRIHLLTPFRLSRQQEVHRRNFRSWVVELTRFD